MATPAELKEYLETRLPHALDLLKAMVEINSFSANPQGVRRLAEFTAECFKPLGFQAEFVPSENPAFGSHLILSRRGTTDRNIALIAHLDTVFSPEEERANNFHWQVEGNRIYGPGTCDIKGGTIMMWLVLSALQRFEPQVFEATGWTLLWNAAEERNSPDFGRLCRSRFNENTIAALVFEGEGKMDSEHLMVLARKGRASWRVKVTGRGAHAGGKHAQGANAIHQLAKTVDRIQRLTDYSKHLTFNVGSISGGTVLNRVPHEAIAEGEFRAFDAAVFEEAKNQLLSMAGAGDIKSAKDGYPCTIDIELHLESRPWPRNPGTDRLYGFWRAAGEALGVPMGWQERGGLSDGNQIWDAVPTLDGLGPWGDNDHCSERSPDGSKLPEFVDSGRFVPKGMVNVTAILELLRASQ